MSWIGQTGASLFQAMQQKSRAHSHFQTLIPFRTRHSVCRDGWRRCQFLPTFSSRPFSGFLDPPDSRNRSLPTSSRGEHVDLGRAGFFTQSTFLAPTPPTHTATLSLPVSPRSSLSSTPASRPVSQRTFFAPAPRPFAIVDITLLALLLPLRFWHYVSHDSYALFSDAGVDGPFQPNFPTRRR